MISKLRKDKMKKNYQQLLDNKENRFVKQELTVVRMRLEGSFYARLNGRIKSSKSAKKKGNAEMFSKNKVEEKPRIFIVTEPGVFARRNKVGQKYILNVKKG